MTFWAFFNDSPIIGLAFSIAAILGAYHSLAAVLDTVAIGLRAKYGGCDCVPCDREHVEEEADAEPEGPSDE